MRSPLTYATLIALLAIVPVAVMEGRPGAFFEPLVLAYALAVVAAMVVALDRHARAQPAALLARLGRAPRVSARARAAAALRLGARARRRAGRARC